jgi:hypothetical protein
VTAGQLLLLHGLHSSPATGMPATAAWRSSHLLLLTTIADTSTRLQRLLLALPPSSGAQFPPKPRFSRFTRTRLGAASSSSEDELSAGTILR